MNNISPSSITYTLPDMRTLVFKNPADMYPVNRYQSLVLANAAYIESVEVSRQSSKSFQDLSAIEVCCGGGPAAVTLKASGVGFVGASDIQLASIEQVRNNAAVNGLMLDSLQTGSGFTPWMRSTAWADVIACNPPCLPSSLIDDRSPAALKTAMSGGQGGTELLFDMLESLDELMNPYGRFVFVVTSMMNFKGIEQFLNLHFPERWRVSPGTPIAAPYCRADGNISERLLKMRDAGETFVWCSDDGWIWRLTWAVAIVGHADKIRGERASFGLYPFGYDPVVKDYWRAMEVFS